MSMCRNNEGDYKGCNTSAADLTRRCIRSIEKLDVVAHEDQVACYCHARVGCSSKQRGSSS
jgi:hypothetical protein